jgi:hypothetical protein
VLSGAGALALAQSSYSGIVVGFGASDSLDLRAFAYARGDQAVFSGHTLTVETATGSKLISVQLGGAYASGDFLVTHDAGGHVLVNFN